MSAAAAEIANVVQRRLEDLGATGWQVKLSDREGWSISLTHPASHGLVLETGTRHVPTALDRAERWIAAIDEVRFASNAPALTHPDLVLELRGLASSFEWQPHEISGVVRVLESHGVITTSEADWLAPRPEHQSGN